MAHLITQGFLQHFQAFSPTKIWENRGQTTISAPMYIGGLTPIFPERSASIGSAKAESGS
jgi:hypothetical protein